MVRGRIRGAPPHVVGHRFGLHVVDGDVATVREQSHRDRRGGEKNTELAHGEMFRRFRFFSGRREYKNEIGLVSARGGVFSSVCTRYCLNICGPRVVRNVRRLQYSTRGVMIIYGRHVTLL